VTTNPECDFELNGWTVIRNFLAPDELGSLTGSVNNALRLPRPSCMNRPGNDLVPLRWNDDIVARMLSAKARLQRLRDLLQAGDLKWLSGYVSIKAPHSCALWWHQDWWCWDHPITFRRPATQVAVLCYLTDTNRDNGALRVLPGSHHKSSAIHGQLPEPHGNDANSLSLDHPAMIDSPDQKTVPVKAGDAVVLDYRLLHGTHGNATPRRRDCILLSFIPNWAGLPPELKAHLAMHPALPSREERPSTYAGIYADLLPHFTGTPASVTISRVAPAHFSAR
jgi:hypothetical protein